jgi:hypothetical protein
LKSVNFHGQVIVRFLLQVIDWQSFTIVKYFSFLVLFVRW